MIKVLSNPASHRSVLVHVEMVFWWINRALNFMKPTVCNCVRTVTLQNKSEYDYYTIGKVFRFKHIISATKLDSDETDRNND